MALSDEQIEQGQQYLKVWQKYTSRPMAAHHLSFARDIEAEVRKQDEALIRQMLEALSLPCDRWNGTQSRIVREEIDAANAWLEAKK